LKTRIRENLEQEQKQSTQADLEKQVVEKLLDENAFAVPTSMVERQLQHLIERQSNKLRSQGISQEDLSKVIEKAKPDVMKQAEKDVRLAYILNAIAAEESIDADEAELNSKIDEIVKRSEQKERNGLEKALRGKYSDQLRSEIRETKLFSWLIEHAKVKEA
jgi:trigger factor